KARYHAVYETSRLEPIGPFFIPVSTVDEVTCIQLQSRFRRFRESLPYNARPKRPYICLHIAEINKLERICWVIAARNKVEPFAPLIALTDTVGIFCIRDKVTENQRMVVG